MVIDDVSVHRTAKEAAMNGGPVSSEGPPEKPKGKPTKKSKQKSAKKSGKAGTASTSVGHLSAEPEVRVGGESVGGRPMTVDVDELDLDETLPEAAAEPEPVAEPGGTGAESPAIDDDFRSTAETPPSGRQRWMHSRAALVSAGALIVALVVGLALSLSALANQNALANSRSSALSAARTYTVELASYNYRDLDRDFSTVAANSTPSFRRTFAESSDALKSTLSRYKATAAAKVVATGVVSVSTSRAVVLVFLDQNIANSTQTKPSTDRSQVEITLVRSGGRWLVDQVTLL